MAASQFTIYSYQDASAPTLNGTVGSLLTVLDAILVNGYGSKAAAGWTKPFANSGNIGCYRSGTGSTLMNYLVNDNAPNATPGAREASVVGWEVLASITGPLGTGTGQWPTAALANTTGYVAWYKSTTADAVARPWIAYADAHTLYLIVYHQSASGNGASFYMMGDFFSVRADATDAYRACLHGLTTTLSAAAPGTTFINDVQVSASGTSGTGVTLYTNSGCFAPRTWGGGGAAIRLNRCADSSTSTYLNANISPMYGVVPISGADNALHMAPLRVFEQASGMFRGRFRGLYCPIHDVSFFGDGMTITGGGDYAGKTFRVFRGGPNSAVWIIETSNTVETN